MFTLWDVFTNMIQWCGGEKWEQNWIIRIIRSVALVVSPCGNAASEKKK
jgi:hypothetical protein